MKTFITAHRALLSRTLVVLLVAFSIAAASPVQILLDFAADQIERQIVNEKLISSMAYVMHTHFPQTDDDKAMLIQVEYLYAGRAAAMEDVVVYLRSLKWDGGKPEDKP